MARGEPHYEIVHAVLRGDPKASLGAQLMLATEVMEHEPSEVAERGRRGLAMILTESNLT
jgi:hypothetical protein